MCILLSLSLSLSLSRVEDHVWMIRHAWRHLTPLPHIHVHDGGEGEEKVNTHKGDGLCDLIWSSALT